MRSLLSPVAVLLVCCSLGLNAAQTPVPAARTPNILWLIAEDLCPSSLSCYGNKDISTPHLDELASEGARYTRAYTTAPVCSSSRSAFNTGMYQTSIGAQNHRSHRGDGYTLPAGVKVIPEWLQQAGYFSTNLSQLPASFGFNVTAKTDWNFTLSAPAFQPCEWAELPARRPFLAQLNFTETHRPLHNSGKVDPQKVTLPPYYPDHPITRQDWAAFLDDVLELDRKVGITLNELNTAGLANDTIVIFMADHGEAQARAKQFLYEEGLNIPLIIRWPKNFPAPSQITPGTVDDRLIEAIDLAPTLLNSAGLPKPVGMQGRNFLGANAEAARQFAFGARDRCDETVFRMRTVRDERYRYIHNFTPEVPFLQANYYKEHFYPVWNLLKQLHAQGRLTPAQDALCQPSMPEEELYDLETDPFEIHNLAGSDKTEHQAALHKLRTALNQWIEETQDQGRVFETPAVISSQTVKH
jgi:arylsulfatase A-like enzyme